MSQFFKKLLGSNIEVDVPQTLVLTTITDQFIGNQPSKLASLIEQSVTINWGDGSPDDIMNLPINTIVNIPQHIYSNTGTEFGIGIEKQVTFTFEDVSFIYLVDFRFCPFVGSFDSNIANFKRLEQFRLVSVTGNGQYPVGFDFFPESIISLSNITVIEFYIVFNTTSPAYYTMPIALFNKPLIGFRYGQTNQFTDKVHSLTNFDKIGQYIDPESGELKQGLSQTLESLQLGVGLSIIQKIPSNLATMQILSTLSLAMKIEEDPTPLINGLSTITNLDITYSSTWGWGNYSQTFIENLTSFDYGFGRFPHTIVQVPSYFQHFSSPITIKARVIAGFNQQNINDHVFSFAQLANLYANKVSGTQLRGVNFQVHQNKPLIGQYRQPNGYVADTNNGNPISVLEWVWVLVNQYSWIVSYDAPKFVININSVPDTEISNQPITLSSIFTNTSGLSPFTYNWEQISGETATINNANSPTTSLSILNSGSYTFRLTVTDSDDLINYDEVSFNIIPDAV